MRYFRPGQVSIFIYSAGQAAGDSLGFRWGWGCRALFQAVFRAGAGLPLGSFRIIAGSWAGLSSYLFRAQVRAIRAAQAAGLLPRRWQFIAGAARRCRWAAGFAIARPPPSRWQAFRATIMPGQAGTSRFATGYYSHYSRVIGVSAVSPGVRAGRRAPARAGPGSGSGWGFR